MRNVKKTKAAQTRALKAVSPKKSFSKPNSTSKKINAAKISAPAEIIAPEPCPPKELALHVKDYIGEIGGPDALRVAECIGDGATDEHIEQSTQLKLAEVRSLLNHLHSYGIVEYNRDKNMANGWFTYTWHINHERATQNYLQNKRKEHAELVKRKMNGDAAMLYKCKKGCVQMGFESAMENRFKCPSCNSNLKYVDATDALKKNEAKMRQIEQMFGRPLP